MILLLLAQFLQALRLTVGNKRYSRSRSRHLLTLQTRSQLYYITLQIFFAGLPYQMLLDLGSNYLVIKGAGCKGKPSRRFACSSCPKLGYFSVGYLDGPVEGQTIQTEMRVGGSYLTGEVLVGSKCGASFEEIEGVAGLRESSGRSNLMSLLIGGELIKQAKFSLDFSFHSKQNNFVSLGEWDFASVKENIELIQLQVLDFSKYQVLVNAAFVNRRQGSLDFQTILDSGNSAISLPRTMASLFLRQLQDLGLKNICQFKQEDSNPNFQYLECRGISLDQIRHLPDIYLQFGKGLVLSFLDYLVRCVEDSPHKFSCQTLIEGYRGDTLILGLPLLSSNVLFVDLQEQVIKLGRKKISRNFQSLFEQ